MKQNSKLINMQILKEVDLIFDSQKLRDPSAESFFDMLQINIFPHLKIISFSFFFSILLFLCFLFQFFSSGIDL